MPTTQSKFWCGLWPKDNNLLCIICFYTGIYEIIESVITISVYHATTAIRLHDRVPLLQLSSFPIQAMNYEHDTGTILHTVLAMGIAFTVTLCIRTCIIGYLFDPSAWALEQVLAWYSPLPATPGENGRRERSQRERLRGASDVVKMEVFRIPEMSQIKKAE
nr:hypothetical protein B0A51_10875 [Rachicladosporium sp. CCFEE 5018]